MRKKLGLWVLSLFIVFPLYSADLQQAEQLYRQDRYAAALAEYEQLLQTYPNDPYLYYNIGNCYFKMHTKGLAVANYYRAFQLAPRDSEIRHNLNLALTSSGERFVPEGMPEVLHKAFWGLTETELKGLFFCTIWICCLIGCIWCIRRRFAVLWFITLGAVLISGSWYAYRNRLAQEPLAVVAAPVAELRSGPGTNFPASANIAQGHVVILQDERDNWREVIVKSQGIKGWIENNALEKI